MKIETQTKIIGWDIGGAHVKAVLLNEEGLIQRVIQEPCPLWKGIDRLHDALAAVMQTLGAGPFRHALTMTGELADCFSSREQGVKAIIKAMQVYCPADELRVFAGEYGLLSVERITAGHAMAIASANWLASAQLVAGHCRTALFVDMGSTTTDILLINDHALKARGHTDYQRLVCGELLYTGAIRTSVMAIAARAVFRDREMGLMAEHFATMADVYRLTGDLQEAHDQAETADGAEKNPQASARRLSRLTGYEFQQADWEIWTDFARQLKTLQKQRVTQAILQQIVRSPQTDELILVGAGVGRFLLKEIALEQRLAYRDFNDFCKTGAGEKIEAADCAPAAALAYLAFYKS
ncbi:MAG: hydantoinase/oxoprolinase family protein [Methylococcales bacterium]|nr:hydantoinase/oxoprolinase family protein [Methylococcales bacterium]